MVYCWLHEQWFIDDFMNNGLLLHEQLFIYLSAHTVMECDGARV